jgi:hypothetical protein
MIEPDENDKVTGITESRPGELDESSKTVQLQVQVAQVIGIVGVEPVQAIGIDKHNANTVGFKLAFYFVQ